jgi:hypothetical protein
LDISVVSPEEAHTFIKNLHNFLNPVEESNLAREEPPATPPNVTQNLRLENMRVLEPNDLLGNVQCSIFPGEESFPPSAEPQTPTDSHHGKIRLSESTSSVSYVSSSSINSSMSTLRRSTRISKRAERDEELSRILQRPSASTERREKEEAKRMAANEKKRKKEKDAHDKFMQAMDKVTESNKKARLENSEVVLRLKHMAEKLRKNLTAQNIKEIIHDNMEHFRNIELGTEDSWRYKAYQKGGRQEQMLFYNLIGEPFSEEQQDVVYEVVKSIWMKEKKIDKIVDVVIVPEIFVRIYQVFFNLSKSEAERNLGNAEGNAIRSNSVSSDEEYFAASL